MWRATGVSYLQYANEMAHILRQSLKDPAREKILKKNRVNILEKQWAGGKAVTRVRHDTIAAAFKQGSKA